MKKIIILLSFFYVNALTAQSIVNSKLDKVAIKIGEQSILSIDVKAPKNSNIIFPTIKDTIIDKVELVEAFKTDTVSKTSNELILRKKYSITSFDSGYYAIPPFNVVVNTDTFKTEAFLLTVNNIAVDTSKAIKEIKQPYDTPFTISEIIKEIIAGSIVIVALIIALIYWIRKRKKKVTVKKAVEIIIPAHELALAEFEKLQNEKLWQEGKVKQYYIRLSDILRTYIQERFKINATEQTTAETIQHLNYANIPSELLQHINKLLMVSDMVKFAKESPLSSDNERCLEDAIYFVKQTIPRLKEDSNNG